MQQPLLNQLLPNLNGPHRGAIQVIEIVYTQCQHLLQQNICSSHVDDATLNPGFLVELALVTFQVGYHINSDGSILPIFVSSVFA